MALIAAHLYAGVILVATVYTPSLLPVHHNPYGFCGLKALC